MGFSALLLDIGNTRLKWGVLSDGRIGRTGSIRHEVLAKSGMTALNRRLPRNVDAVLASNVAGPAFGARLASFIGIHCGVDMRFARPNREGFGIRNAYEQPRRLGIDRWAAMIGAHSQSKSAICLVDAGSAITIDALDRTGRHLGGQIVPGLELMHQSLLDHTNGSKGRRVRTFSPESDMDIFANRTERAIQAGALNSICGAIERSVAILRKGGLRPKLLVTGGGATPILAELGDKAVHRPHLVLQGLAIMLDAPK